MFGEKRQKRACGRSRVEVPEVKRWPQVGRPGGVGGTLVGVAGAELHPELRSQIASQI